MDKVKKKCTGGLTRGVGEVPSSGGEEHGASQVGKDQNRTAD